ncbi:phage virion morphogenesis protein [Sphingomonas sp. LB2R24]|uniref:phage virion morphogenesis protein n=1 Tax=Sphingomonas sorbitolis TaxID=3096165 RepID=UPI002FCA1DB9
MSDGFAEIEAIAGALLRQLAPAARRSLLRRMARDVQKTQSARIGRQQSPDGQRYESRRPKKAAKPGNFAVHFLYPKGATEPRAVLMKSWVRQGPLVTGFDVEAGGIRSFFWDKVDRWLPVDQAQQNASAGKYRRQGSIKQRAMFRKLRNGRNLRAGASDSEAWIGFTGRAAEIAAVHQEGGTDRPSMKAKPVRYAQRKLLGLTDVERSRALDLLLETVTAAL